VIRLPLSGDVQNPIIVAHNARLEAVDKRRLKSVRMATGWSRDCNRSLLATGLLSSKVTDQTHFRRITFVQNPSRNNSCSVTRDAFWTNELNLESTTKSPFKMTKKAARSKAVFYPGAACHSILTYTRGPALSSNRHHWRRSTIFNLCTTKTNFRLKFGREFCQSYAVVNYFIMSFYQLRNGSSARGP